MFKETKEGQTHSYPIVTIKDIGHDRWHIKIEREPKIFGEIFITNQELKALQFGLNRILK